LKVSAREKAGAFPLRSCEGTVHGIAHQVKPGWQAAGRYGGPWGSRKNADGPLPRFYLMAVPDVFREASCAPPRPASVEIGRVRRGASLGMTVFFRV
jgi:hypothetical protein